MCKLKGKGKGYVWANKGKGKGYANMGKLPLATLPSLFPRDAAGVPRAGKGNKSRDPLLHMDPGGGMGIRHMDFPDSQKSVLTPVDH